jgi:hypothetical protein
MTGRERMEAAFSRDGTREIPAVICYEALYIRDHWKALCSKPWWAAHLPDLNALMEIQREIVPRIGQDWFRVPATCPREERKAVRIELRDGRAFKVDSRTGKETALAEPQVGGWMGADQPHSIHPDRLVDSAEEIDRIIGAPSSPPKPITPRNRASQLRPPADGRGDLAAAMIAAYGRDKMPFAHISGPVWQCYYIWGFEGLMTLLADKPKLVSHACERFARRTLDEIRAWARLGARAVWIEECLTDMISPEAFARFNLPLLRTLVDEIRACGMKSIYYYCGNLSGKWDLLLDVGADALSLEESKKGFTIDIEQIAGWVKGRCTILGNLDAVGVLERGTDEQLRREIARQIGAGRRNGSRFIMSLGSPVTPHTPVERVRQYCELVHELGGG